MLGLTTGVAGPRPASALVAFIRMLRLASPVLRMVVAPAAVAVFSGFALWPAGPFVAVSVGWCVFVLSVFAVDAWGRIQLQRAKRHLRSLRGRGSRPLR